VVVLVGIMSAVSKIIGNDSDTTTAPGEAFEGGKGIVYKKRSFGIGGYPVHLSLIVLL